MSTPAGIGVYASTGLAPANVKDRPWRGVYHHWSGEPDDLGQQLIDSVKKRSGDLAGLVRAVVDQAPYGWSSLAERRPYPADDPGFAVSPTDVANTCWVYLFDLEARRLDVFATYADARGAYAGSVSFDAAGVAKPSAFVLVEPPGPSGAAVETWLPSTPQELAQRADVRRRVVRDCEAASLSVEGFIELVSHALSETFFRAEWRGRSQSQVLTQVFLSRSGPWRVRLGQLEVFYPEQSRRVVY